MMLECKKEDGMRPDWLIKGAGRSQIKDLVDPTEQGITDWS